MLYASFVRPEGVYNSLFNKFAAMATGGPFCHSEFIFRWSEDQVKEVLSRVKGLGSLRNRSGPVDIAVYIIWGDIVRYRILTGYSPFWSVPERDILHIDIPWENELNTITWLSNQLGTHYDKTGALLSIIPWRKKSLAYESYFCSQLMVCALQRLNMLTHCNPGNVTPNTLHHFLHGA